jgi:serine/threonine-protein kinase RsbW
MWQIITVKGPHFYSKGPESMDDSKSQENSVIRPAGRPHGEKVPRQWRGKAALENLQDISDFLTRWLKTIEGYCHRKKERYLVELAVIEALTNIIQYAYPDTPQGEVRILLQHNKNLIEIEIQDCGVPFDPLFFSPPNLDKPGERGYGVFLMKKIMNTIRYERRDNKINCLHMTRDVPKGLANDAP